MKLHVLHVLVYTAHTLKFYVAGDFGLSLNIIPTKISTYMVDVSSSLARSSNLIILNSLSSSLRLGEVDWLTEVGNVYVKVSKTLEKLTNKAIILKWWVAGISRCVCKYKQWQKVSSILEIHTSITEHRTIVQYLLLDMTSPKTISIVLQSFPPPVIGLWQYRCFHDRGVMEF